ncbi:hypothetical protein AB4345_05355 [Vibrio breoganii]
MAQSWTRNSEGVTQAGEATVHKSDALGGRITDDRMLNIPSHEQTIQASRQGGQGSVTRTANYMGDQFDTREREIIQGHRVADRAEVNRIRRKMIDRGASHAEINATLANITGAS